VTGLRFEGVHKRFGDVHALRGLDLDVAEGELMVLAGPSGCGKTTALRVAAGLESPSEGRVRIKDRDVTRLAPVERNVSMVFQSYALFPHLSVGDNIGFGLVARWVRRAEVVERVRAAAELLGCDHLLSRRPSELSGGERQRVALARALVRHPDVFLLDEPLSNLDAQLRVRMRAELKLLHQRVGGTMIYVTHDQVEALTLGDRLAVLRDGALQQVGTPDEVYRRPRTRFVATFIGSPAMNVLRASLAGSVVAAGPFSVAVDDPGDLADHRLELGIRPEHLEVSLARNAGAPLRVEIVEPAGGETFLHLSGLRPSGQQPSGVAPAAGTETLVARVGADLRPPVGSTVWARPARDAAFVFDADDGTTLYPR
jgi:ABC-type sugar transport system ATPase subunit